MRNFKNTIISLMVFLFLFFFLFYDTLTKVLEAHPISGTLAFIFLYIVLVKVFVQGSSLTRNPKLFLRRALAWFFIFLAGELILYPFMLEKNGTIHTDGNLKISADYVAYSLTPKQLPYIVRYYMVYVLYPVALLMLSYKLFPNDREFNNAVGGIV